MADSLKPCCEKTRAEYIDRLVQSVQSYPVIKTVPCPTCRHVIPIRVYGPPDEATSDA